MGLFIYSSDNPDLHRTITKIVIELNTISDITAAVREVVQLLDISQAVPEQNMEQDEGI